MPDAKGAKVERRSRKEYKINSNFFKYKTIRNAFVAGFGIFHVFFRVLRATLAPFASGISVFGIHTQ